MRIPYVPSTSEYPFSTSELWASARLWQRRLWSQAGIPWNPLVGTPLGTLLGAKCAKQSRQENTLQKVVSCQCHMTKQWRDGLYSSVEVAAPSDRQCLLLGNFSPTSERQKPAKTRHAWLSITMLLLPVEILLPFELKRGDRAVMDYLLSTAERRVTRRGGKVIRVCGLGPL